MKTFVVSIALTMAALFLTPVAHAGMLTGNYLLEVDRDYPNHKWIWSVRPCATAAPDCVRIQAIPQPNGQAAPYDTEAYLSNGRYTMIVDVPDGVRCVVQFLPSHDVYSWDAATLAGSLDSTYDTGCGGAPGGTTNYPFNLVRY